MIGFGRINRIDVVPFEVLLTPITCVIVQRQQLNVFPNIYLARVVWYRSSYSLTESALLIIPLCCAFPANIVYASS